MYNIIIFIGVYNININLSLLLLYSPPYSRVVRLLFLLRMIFIFVIIVVVTRVNTVLNCHLSTHTSLKVLHSSLEHLNYIRHIVLVCLTSRFPIPQ